MWRPPSTRCSPIREPRSSVSRRLPPPAWENFVLPLAAAQDRLDRAWGQVVHLNAVVNTPALRKSMPY